MAKKTYQIEFTSQLAKTIQKVLTILVVIASIAFVYGLGASVNGKIKREERRENERIQGLCQEAAEDCEIAITNKVNSYEYSSSLKVELTITIENKYSMAINYIEGELEIMDSEGNVLSSGTAYFGTTATTTERGYSFPADSKETYTLKWEMNKTAGAVQIWNSDYSTLSFSYKITGIRLENNGIFEVSCVPMVKKVDSKFELAYENAVSLYNKGKYAEALPLFAELGTYKDSYNYYTECATYVETVVNGEKYDQAIALVEQEKYKEALEIFNELLYDDYKGSQEKIDEIFALVESEAEKSAYAGDYTTGVALLSQLGYTESNSGLYAAYKYAESGDFVSAVQRGLKVLRFPEGTEIIPNNYLNNDNNYGSYDLEKVILPTSIKTIGNSAFKKCSKLVEINFPEGLVSIGSSAFSGCANLTSIVLPEGLLAIGDSAFSGCSKLKNIQWPSSLQTIGKSAFRYCSAITNLSLPSSLVSLGEMAFSNCAGILVVTFTSGVKTISAKAFQDCTRLMQVVFSSGTETISEYAFDGCLMLTSVSLPNTLKEINNNAFYECIALVEIVIPAQVTRIAQYAFALCTSLQYVYFENTEGWKDGFQQQKNVTDAEKNAQVLVSGTGTSWYRD